MQTGLQSPSHISPCQHSHSLHKITFTWYSLTIYDNITWHQNISSLFLVPFGNSNSSPFLYFRHNTGLCYTYVLILFIHLLQEYQTHFKCKYMNAHAEIECDKFVWNFPKFSEILWVSRWVGMLSVHSSSRQTDRQTDRQCDSGLYTKETMQFLIIHDLFISVTVRLSTDVWTAMMSSRLLCTWWWFVMTRYTGTSTATAAGPNTAAAAARHTRFRCHAWWPREQLSYTCFEVTMIIILDHTQTNHAQTSVF